MTKSNMRISCEDVNPDHFYVYVHKRISDDNIFYVGKGHGDRAKRSSSRNNYWHNVVNKHGFYYEIIMTFENEVCAFSFEMALIKMKGIDTLANLTVGGEGVRGFNRSDKQKKDHSIRMSGEGHPQYGKPHSEDMRKRLSLIAKTNPKSIEARLRNAKARRKKIRCSNGMIFSAVKFASQWVKENVNEKASHQNICAAANGKLKSAYGFTWEYV